MSDLYVARSMKDLQQLLASAGVDGGLCFDVGANVGAMTAALIGVGAKVVALEPQPDLASHLEQSFPDEVLAGTLVVVRKAAGDRAGHALLHLSSDPGRSMSTLSEQFIDISRANGDPWDLAATLEVELVTLDSLIKEYGVPEYVKIDVEGFDDHVLDGLSRSVRVVSFEFNTQAGLIDVAERCLDRLGALGRYEFNFQVETPGLRQLQLPAWVPGSVMRFTLRHEIAATPCFGDIYARLFTPQ